MSSRIGAYSGEERSVLVDSRAYYFCEWSPGPAWKNSPEIYMMTKLLWDINQDADALIDEW